MTANLVPDAAANLAAWHDSSLHALDLRCERDATLWHCTETHPRMFFAAVTLGGPESKDDHLAGIEALARERSGDDFAVCDSFASLDLRPLGFEEMRQSTWMVRRPGAPERGEFPRDLVIERVLTDRQLAEWEAASIAGFQLRDTPPPGGLHAPAILSDGRMQVFAGKVDGHIVSGAMGYLTERVNGVYAVSTLPDYRRRGYGEWLTWRVVLARPYQPATLQPSPEAESLYRKMGFETMGEYTVWRHRAS